MTKQTRNNLSFVDAQQLEQNLSLALADMDQTLSSQKLKEMAARVQGYPSVNHRSAEGGKYKDEVKFIVQNIENNSGVEYADLDVDCLVVYLKKSDFLRIKKAHEAAQTIDNYASISFGCGEVYAYRDVMEATLTKDNYSDSAYVDTFLDELEKNETVRITGVEFNVSAHDKGYAWVSGREKYGCPFSTAHISLRALESAFTSTYPQNDYWVLASGGLL